MAGTNPSVSGSHPTVTLVTGTSSGIGRALVETLAKRAQQTVIAAVRDPTAGPAMELSRLRCGEGSRVVVVKIDSEVDADAGEAMRTLTTTHSVTHLDTVIANAGIGEYYGPAAGTPAAELQRHFRVNAVAPLLLFQAAEALLKQSAAPKFAIMSSNIASLGLMEHITFPGTAYGASKCASNFITRKLHFENDWLTAVVLDPGWVPLCELGYLIRRVS